jgi:hypothetical protein
VKKCPHTDDGLRPRKKKHLHPHRHNDADGEMTPQKRMQMSTWRRRHSVIRAVAVSSN